MLQIFCKQNQGDHPGITGNQSRFPKCPYEEKVGSNNTVTKIYGGENYRLDHIL